MKMHSNEENKEEPKENSFKHSDVRKRRTKTDNSDSSQPVRLEYVLGEDGEEKRVEVRRRRRRRSHQPKKVKEKREKIARRILIFGSIPFILLLASLYFFMLTWISGQGFRKEVSAKVSEILETDVEFGVFNLDGLNLNARNLVLKSELGDSLLKDFEIKLLETRINPRSFISNNWHMGNIQAQSGEMFFWAGNNNVSNNGRIQKRNRTLVSAGLGLQSDPGSFNFERLRIADSMMYWKNNDGQNMAFIKNAKLAAEDFSNSSSLVSFRGGKLALPGWPLLEIDAIAGEVRSGKYFIKSSKFSHSIRGSVNLNGYVSIKGEGEYQISSDFNNIDVSKIVHSYWAERLTGQLTGGLGISGSLSVDQSMNAEGSFEGSGMELSKEPILVSIAKELNEVSFRQLRFESLSASFKKSGKGLEIFDIKGESLPLMRLNGGNIKVLADGQLEGLLKVGVADAIFKGSGVVRPLYFARNEDNHFWANLIISGSIDSPRANFVRTTKNSGQSSNDKEKDAESLENASLQQPAGNQADDRATTLEKNFNKLLESKN
jgi:hypothetical protein